MQLMSVTAEVFHMCNGLSKVVHPANIWFISVTEEVSQVCNG